MIRVAIPIFRVSCTVAIDKIRPWSIVDELMLWALSRRAGTITELCTESSLPRQLVLASIARLMRFGLVEVSIGPRGPAFQASDRGMQTLRSGERLPQFPIRYWKGASFVVCKATGDVFATRDVMLLSDYRLRQAQSEGIETRQIEVTVGGPDMTTEANLARLSSIAVAHRLDEELANVDQRTASLSADEFIVVRVSGQEINGLPSGAGEWLHELILRTAALPAGKKKLQVAYQGPAPARDAEFGPRSFTFDPGDLVIGTEDGKIRFIELLGRAENRVIVHSTFLRAGRFDALKEPIRAACARGVTFDIFWGGEANEKTASENLAAAVDILNIVEADRDLREHFRISLTPTGSHAKLMLLDTAQGWTAVVSTCNWLYSDFSRSVEIAVELREPALVADTATVLQRLIGQRGLSDGVAIELSGVIRHLRALPQRGGGGRATIICGAQHDALMRAASGGSEQRFFVGTHRLGSTARPGAIMQAEVAARRHGNVTVLYTMPSGPIKKRHARELTSEEALEGVHVVCTRKNGLNLHAKFVVWDDNDLLVTSLNWGSASTDVDSPCDEVGIHIHAPGIGAHTLARMCEFFPELDTESRIM